MEEMEVRGQLAAEKDHAEALRRLLEDALRHARQAHADAVPGPRVSLPTLCRAPNPSRSFMLSRTGPLGLQGDDMAAAFLQISA